jgi:hypothetical protein
MNAQKDAEDAGEKLARAAQAGQRALRNRNDPYSRSKYMGGARKTKKARRAKKSTRRRR